MANFPFLKQKLLKFNKFSGFQFKFNQIIWLTSQKFQHQKNEKNNGRLPFSSKNIVSGEYLFILFYYLRSMTFYQSILYFDIDTFIFQHVKILAKK